MERKLTAVTGGGAKLRISHARPDALLSHRVKAPLFLVDDDGNTHTVSEWSLESIQRPATLGAEVNSGQLCLNFQGFSIAFPVKFRIIGYGGEMAFDGLDRRQSELLRHFYAGIQSGRMTSVEETILSMDLPVERPAMTPTPDDEMEGKEPLSRWIRATAAIGFYLVLTSAVVASLAYTIWANTNFITASGGQLLGSGEVPTVEAWLEEDQIENVWIGMASTVIANIGGVRTEDSATVVDLERQPVSADSTETRVRVSATFDDATGFAKAPPPEGHPVVLQLDRGLFGWGRP